MLSGKVSLRGSDAVRQLAALFQQYLSAHLFADVLTLSESTVLLVWEGRTGRTLIDDIVQPGDAPAGLDYAAIRAAIHRWPLQAVSVQFSAGFERSPTLIVERNHHAFCPLYYLQKGGDVHFHWDPTALYVHLTGSDILDRAQCEAFLNLRWNYGPDTVFRDIKMIPERATITFDPQGSHIDRPPSVAALAPQSLNDDAEPVIELQAILMDALAWWSPEPGRVFCEQSSGLDTTLVSLLTGKVLGTPPQTFGYYPLDAHVDDIRARREEAVHLIGGDELCHLTSQEISASQMACGFRTRIGA